MIDVLEHGYLPQYEAAYRAGRIEDYPLFPSERLAHGLTKWREEPKPLSRDAALKMFYRLEIVAGVDHVDGRGWYGVRRIAADLVEDVESDERVQDAVLADSKGTRHGHYQVKRRPKILMQAAKARVKMRGGSASSVEHSMPAEEILAALHTAGITLTGAQIQALGTAIIDVDESLNGADESCHYAPRCTPTHNRRSTSAPRRSCSVFHHNGLRKERVTGSDRQQFVTFRRPCASGRCSRIAFTAGVG